VRLAILGGSFNPVHIGHLALAEDVVVSLGYDRLLLVPSFKSPFKADPEGATPDDRLDMLAASVEGDRRVAVEDCELRRGDVSYTIDTVAELERRFRPEGKIGVVLGDDLATGFNAWMHAEELASRTDLIVGRRVADGSIPFSFPHRTLSNERIELSSTEIRRRIAAGGSWRYLVSDGTRRIIEDRTLYGFRPNGGYRSSHSDRTPLSVIASVERDVRLGMKTSRYLHSRGVALLAAGLCDRFGLDPEAGYLAGIAHDLCKEYPAEKMRELALADGRGLSELETAKPSLLHARAAAVLLRERYGIVDNAILDAVRLHISGEIGMGTLAKIVYVADKIETSRTWVDPALRELARTADLEALFGETLRRTAAYLRSKDRVIAEGTLQLLAEGKEL
jgi:nicotinate-nucleotide adenylyltransferase